MVTNEHVISQGQDSDFGRPSGTQGPQFPAVRRYFQGMKRKGKPQKAMELCPLCREMAALVQDHCHASGLCRDRICVRCNNLLGRVEWKPERLQVLLEYIERWRWEHSHGGAVYRGGK